MMRSNKKLFILIAACAFNLTGFAQSNALTNTSESPHAKVSSVDMGAVQWTQGFWAERFKVCKETMVPNIWQIYKNPEVSHAFRNFEIAAGLAEGEHKGPSFHDGDFYKVLESLASTYAITKDPQLDKEMDEAIAVIAKVQQEDGYIYTPAIIQKRTNTGSGTAFQQKINFEAYNLGHLMTAACVHYRATGKTTLLEVAKKATDFLYNYYKNASPELARNAICPSHYMGTVEMYRTTKNPKYLELAQNLVNIHGQTDVGTDDNQDRIPFRQQKKAMGHAVRANYLYAGVADVVAETGDVELKNTLGLMWNDVVHRKMYVTGGCGSLYDGVSPDGTSYNPKEVQKIHQAYGRDCQLPNFTAHNETCANIGNVLWNWRMFHLSPEAKYVDIMELALYNSVLSGISLDGKGFLYTNPLSYSDDLPFQQRWSKQRVGYISLSNCCPPNTVRTISEVSHYAYSLAENGLYVNLYGGNKLSTNLRNGSAVSLTQTTNYPWDGNISIELDKVPDSAMSLYLRIPGWSENAKILINGKSHSAKPISGEYFEINRTWTKGDKVELILPMDVNLLEANPLVEETRNQVAVKRGPVVYCLESVDIPEGNKIFDIAIPVKNKFRHKMVTIENSEVGVLEGKAMIVSNSRWENKLYKKVSESKPRPAQVRLVPYYAWGNRGRVDMTVWMPVLR